MESCRNIEDGRLTDSCRWHTGDNKVHVANPASIDAFSRQAPKGSIYVEFDVPSETVFPGGKDGCGLYRDRVLCMID